MIVIGLDQNRLPRNSRTFPAPTVPLDLIDLFRNGMTQPFSHQLEQNRKARTTTTLKKQIMSIRWHDQS